MSTTTADKTELLEPLLRRLDELERRLSRIELEGCQHSGPAIAELAQQPSPQVLPAATPLGPNRVGVVVGSLAKAVLGLAGAFFLRAGTESGWLPHSAGVLAAFVYALVWLFIAGRIANLDQAASPIYALTSATMFLGLVWENTVHSAILSPSVATLAIVAYLGVGELVALVRHANQIAAVTVASMVSLSLGLFVATHNLIPFDISLLCVAALSEFAACRGRRLGQRWMAALGADFAVLITAWIFSQAATLPEGYAPYSQLSVLAIQLALVLIYLGSTLYRALTTQVAITAFEIGQNGIAIGLFILGQVDMAPIGTPHVLVGYICAVIALGAYAASIFLARKHAQRTSVAFGVFGLALLTFATSVLWPPDVRVFTLSILGAAIAWLGKHERQMIFEVQAPVYLFAATLASGLMAISAQSLTDLIVPRADHLVALLATAAAVATAYALAGSSRPDRSRIPPLLCAALLGSLFVATSLRLGLICLAAVGSARWGMSSHSYGDGQEWVWLSYALMLYGAWRILVENLPGGGPGAAALSLLVYGSTLLLLTRILRSRHPT